MRLEDYEYYRTDNGVLYCGDVIDILLLIENNIIDLIIIDPPYELDNQGGTSTVLKDRALKIRNKLKNLSCGFNHYNIFEEFKRILKKFNLFCFCSNKQISKLMRWGEKNKYYTTLLAWEKTNATPFCNNVWRQDLEFIIHIREEKAIFIGGCKIKKKLFSSPTNRNNEHPTVKPIELIKKYILIGSNEQNMILDCFAGSSTTAIACESLNRKWICIEKEEEYCKISKQRIEQEARQLKMF